MDKSLAILMMFQFSLFGCYNEQKNTGTIDTDYIKYKASFEKEFTAHFPDSIEVIMTPEKSNSIHCKTNKSKHDVGFLLYEYGVSTEYLQRIENKIQNNHLAIYKSTDSCLLVVNRFETLESYKNRDIPKIYDSTAVNLECLSKMYPVPHFLDYKNATQGSVIHLNESFSIYVLEAKPENPFKNFQMEPFVQMPAKWKNGYSKGIALSEKERTVIYWSIMW